MSGSETRAEHGPWMKSHVGVGDPRRAWSHVGVRDPRLAQDDRHVGVGDPRLAW
jgi:hypothetical protein